MITLTSLSRHSAQAVFAQLSDHLLSMTEPCLQENGVIGAYHHHETRSPAGSLMSEDEYFPQMEGRNWWKLAQLGVVPEAHAELIEEIEYIHDGFPPEAWESHLLALAERRQLSAPFCQAA